jgi:CDP-paratose 2-epimerase
MNNERILITGGCGFVGSHLALKLKMDYPSAKIIVMDNLKRRGSELNIQRLKENDINFIHGDIRMKEDFNEVGEISLLIEAAAEPSVLSGIDSSPDYVIDTNLNGTLNCLHYARKYNARFLFLSTSRVYPIHQLNKIDFEEGETRFNIRPKQSINGVTMKGINEAFPLAGARSFYGSSKLSAELFIQEYMEFYGMKGIINRCGVLTGPWQMGKVDQGVIVLWMARHFWKGELNYIGFGGSGKQVRDLLHVNDLYRLVKIQLNDFEKFNGQVFNVGGGNDVSVSLKELTSLCEEITGNKIKINSVIENRSADIPIYITDNSKINSISGWRPEISVKETLKDIHSWIQKDQDRIKTLLN